MCACVFLKIFSLLKLGIVVHTCNHSTQEAEAEELQIEAILDYVERHLYPVLI
jgi:hypothetical protein